MTDCCTARNLLPLPSRRNRPGRASELGSEGFDQRFAGARHETSLWFIQGHHRIEIDGVQVLLENTGQSSGLSGGMATLLVLGST